MRNPRFFAFAFLLLVFCLSACTNAADNKEKSPEATAYKPDSLELYNAIVQQDSIYFTAYNTCDMETQTAYYSDTLEFYHDKGGFMNSKRDVLDGIKKNICDKVTRELVKGSIEVYPIKDWGAIEMGQHMFHNSQEPNSVPHASKFIIFWQQTPTRWLIKRVVSLH